VTFERLEFEGTVEVEVDGLRAEVTGSGDALVVSTKQPLRLARKLWPLRSAFGALPVDLRLRLNPTRDLLLRRGELPRLVRAL